MFKHGVYSDNFKILPIGHGTVFVYIQTMWGLCELNSPHTCVYTRKKEEIKERREDFMQHTGHQVHVAADLDNVVAATEVPCIDCRCLGSKSTAVQLGYLLASPQDHSGVRPAEQEIGMLPHPFSSTLPLLSLPLLTTPLPLFPFQLLCSIVPLLLLLKQRGLHHYSNGEKSLLPVNTNCILSTHLFIYSGLFIP